MGCVLQCGPRGIDRTVDYNSMNTGVRRHHHVVFDFDCTLTGQHWWKGIWQGRFARDSRAGEVPLTEDEELFLSEARTYEFVAHKSPYFPKLEGLLHHAWGGKERLQTTQNFLIALKSTDTLLSISTNGQVNEVMGVLGISGIPLDTFAYIHGYDDKREKKIAYAVQEGEYSVFKSRSKEEFIHTVCDPEDASKCIYIDDDPCEYARVQSLCHTIPLDKEAAGMTTEHMDEILRLVSVSDI